MQEQVILRKQSLFNLKKHEVPASQKVTGGGGGTKQTPTKAAFLARIQYSRLSAIYM